MDPMGKKLCIVLPHTDFFREISLSSMARFGNKIGGDRKTVYTRFLAKDERFASFYPMAIEKEIIMQVVVKYPRIKRIQKLTNHVDIYIYIHVGANTHVRPCRTNMFPGRSHMAHQGF